MVPEGWSSVEMGDLYDFKNGLNTDKANYGHGLKFVNVMDVFKNDRLDEKNIIGRVAVNDKEMINYSLEYGDVLFNRTSETFDEIAMSAVYLDEKPAIFGGFVIRARPKTNKVSPEFSVYFFQSSVFRSEAVSRGQGAVRANIGQKDLAGICQVVPPVVEQQKIAKILSTWDEAIATTEQLLANSEQQKKSLMQQLLAGKKRLPGFEREWNTKIFSSIVELGKEKFDPKNSDQTIECIELEHISQGTAILSGSTTTYKSVSTKNCFHNGSVLFGKLRPYLRKYWLADRNGVCSTEIWVINANRKFSIPEYIFYLVQSEFFIDAASKSSGTHMPRADWNIVKDILIHVPSLKEQKKIAGVLSSHDKEIVALRYDLGLLQKQKKALMQQLLTGKRRVKVDEEQSDAVPA